MTVRPEMPLSELSDGDHALLLAASSGVVQASGMDALRNQLMEAAQRLARYHSISTTQRQQNGPISQHSRQQP